MSGDPAGESRLFQFQAQPPVLVSRVLLGAVPQFGVACVTLAFPGGYCSLAWPGLLPVQLMLVGSVAQPGAISPQCWS